MNNFTKTEALPKTGHVNEVCKEWLVREDSALAYKLQSQEINDFYKGNRQRNAVVREDFPTALNEQIKEKEQAEKQVEIYRRRLLEQEVYDKRVAKEIADKLERDLQEQRQRELLESEEIAQQMQELYVNLPAPSRAKAHHPPPRPAKASILQQNPNEPSTSNGRYFGSSSNSSSQHSHHQHQQQHKQQRQQQSQSPQMPQQQQPPSTASQYQQQHQSQQQLSPASFLLQQKHFSQTDCYVGLTVQKTPSPTTASANAIDSSSPPTSSTRQQHSRSQLNALSSSSSSSVAAAGHLLQQHQHQHSLSSISTGSAASTSSAPPAASTGSSSVLTSSFAQLQPHSQPQHNQFYSPTAQEQKRKALDSHHPNPQAPYTNHSPTQPSTPPSGHQQPLHQRQHSVEELIEYSDVADSIRHLDRSTAAAAVGGSGGTVVDGFTPDSPQHNTFSNTSSSNPKSPSVALTNRLHSVSNENLLRNEHKFQKLSPEKYDQLVGNDGSGRGMNNNVAAERHMQAHADDIELYVDPCDYASLKEIGLPMEEIKEMSKKLKQEQKDELLARRLQQMETIDGLTQEERDRLLAIEAQDKELAKMLQERERAKAKRAKEKARLRKHQQKDVGGSSMLCTSNGSTSNGLHCGPLLPLPQDCLSFGKHSTAHATPAPIATAHPNAQSGLHLMAEAVDDILDVEAYSNPIDVLHNQQQSQQRQQQNGTLTNGSLTREGGRRSTNSSQHNGNNAHNNNGSLLNRVDDDIYTLPVDSCRPGQRPASMSISPTAEVQLLQHNSMTRSENYSIDSHDSLNRHELAPRMNYSQSSTFDKSSSPTPPYMPIQGTRRSNSSDDRKKKSKDKCTHQ